MAKKSLFGSILSAFAKSTDKSIAERLKNAESSKKNVNQSNKGDVSDFMSEIRKKTSELKKWNQEWERINFPIVDFNNKGIAFEKEGDIKKAIIEYEKCLKWIYDHFDGEYIKQIAWHSPNRLRILYKKEKNQIEKEFLQEFTLFCFEHEIECPEAFKKQLEKLNN